jgi:hypothetical protein
MMSKKMIKDDLNDDLTSSLAKQVAGIISATTGHIEPILHQSIALESFPGYEALFRDSYPQGQKKFVFW